MKKFILIICIICFLTSVSLAFYKIIQYYSYNKITTENRKIVYTKKRINETQKEVEEAMKKEEEVKKGKNEEIEVFNTWKKMLSQIREDTK